jgi:hypothetical protein
MEEMDNDLSFFLVLLTNVDVEITSNSPPQPSKNIQK